MGYPKKIYRIGVDRLDTIRYNITVGLRYSLYYTTLIKELITMGNPLKRELVKLSVGFEDWLSYVRSINQTLHLSDAFDYIDAVEDQDISEELEEQILQYGPDTTVTELQHMAGGNLYGRR